MAFEVWSEDPSRVWKSTSRHWIRKIRREAVRKPCEKSEKKRWSLFFQWTCRCFFVELKKKRCNTLSEDLIQLRTNKLGAHKIPKKCGSGRGVFMLFCHSETAVLRCNSLQDFEKNTQFCWRRWSQSLRFDGESVGAWWGCWHQHLSSIQPPKSQRRDLERFCRNSQLTNKENKNQLFYS